ncbi:MAG: AMP-dependent synthetase/ligase [Sandaracinaceae bacterium]
MTLLHDGPHVPVQGTARSARTVGDMFRLRAARSASAPAFFDKRSGRFEPVTWSEAYRAARAVARGLLTRCSPGDRVAICGPTQVPWATYDLGAQLATMVSFGIYPKQTVEQVRYLLENADARVVFVDEPEELETVLAAAKDLPQVVAIVPWSEALFAEHRARDPRLVSPSAFAGEPLTDAEVDALQAARAPDDLAVLIYTSGTTGPPKGAMISHRNILSLLTASERVQRLLQSDLSLHFLPMAHSAERILGFYGRVSAGMPGAYAGSTATVLDDLRTVRPTVFGSVPRIFEKAHARIYSEIEKRPPALRKLFHWAVGVGVERARRQLAGERVAPMLDAQFMLADRVFFRRIRDVFGGRIRMMIAGAAPTTKTILEFFWAVGLPIYEAYGMTEATVITHCNRPGEVRLGTVGRVLEPMEARLAEDGEVLLRGPFVFQGYFKSPEASAAALDGGWLHTGDVGVIDPDGYLRITDRKKHLIITAGGKNLAPANIEKAIKEEDALISHVLAHGDRRPYVSAIVAPSPLETLEWGLSKGLCTKEVFAARQAELMANPAGRTQALADAMAPIVAHPELRARLREAVRRGNEKLAHVEQVRRFFVIERDFSQEAGELTPTMKVKRKEVEKAYAAKLDLLYDDPSFGMDA